MIEEEEQEETGPLEAFGEPKDPNDDVVAFCVDCTSIVPDKMAEKSRFLQTGSGPGVCPFCGGPMVPAYKSAIKGMRAKRKEGGRLL